MVTSPYLLYYCQHINALPFLRILMQRPRRHTMRSINRSSVAVRFLARLSLKGDCPGCLRQTNIILKISQDTSLMITRISFLYPIWMALLANQEVF
jgi:hypothetical protein